MSGSDPEKVALGRQKAKEFFGEKHAKELRDTGPVCYLSLSVHQPVSSYAYQVVDQLLTPKFQKPDIYNTTVQDFVMEVCFTGYARPGLAFRERSLMNMGMLIALNRHDELQIHIQAAFHNGFTEEQICEACRHAMVYCGVPAGRDALLTASAVAAKLKEQGELPK